MGIHGGERAADRMTEERRKVGRDLEKGRPRREADNVSAWQNYQLPPSGWVHQFPIIQLASGLDEIEATPLMTVDGRNGDLALEKTWQSG